jgi:hypothetical protein
MSLFAFLDWTVQLPLSVSLAAIAAIGYLVGRRRKTLVASIDADGGERQRAQQVAKELENIAATVRQELAAHHAMVLKFRNRVDALGTGTNEETWQALRQEAESILRPTQKFAAQLQSAYDGIRKQTGQLSVAGKARVDRVRA